MLILVSDLHLTDTVERCTFNARRFIESLNRIVREAGDKGIKKVTVILLGDIFELLKSREWIDKEIRPWEATSETHADAVESIFRSILNCNAEFFEGFQKLSKNHPFVVIRYLPGNHDSPISTAMGLRARALLNDTLLAGSDDTELKEYLIDSAHETIARHGHEWDPDNRYKNGHAAIGDAIVIDLLLSLPILVAEKMQMDINDASLSFLHELDNVLPQSPATMARWILQGLDRMKEHHPGAGKIFQEAFSELSSGLKEVTKTVRFETTAQATWWINFLARAMTALANNFGVLATAVRLPDIGNPGSPYSELAKNDFAVTRNATTPHRFVVCGHTHDPEVKVVETEQRRIPPRIYLNTGAWRKVHFASGGKRPIFETWEVGCFAIIYNRAEQSSGLPPYEFHRMIRGV